MESTSLGLSAVVTSSCPRHESWDGPAQTRPAQHRGVDARGEPGGRVLCESCEYAASAFGPVPKGSLRLTEFSFCFSNQDLVICREFGPIRKDSLS